MATTHAVLTSAPNQIARSSLQPFSSPMSIAPTQGSSHPPSQKPGALGKQHVDIVTIPEKFYGVALTMNGATQSERETPAPLPPPRPAPAIVQPSERRTPWALIIVVVVLVLGVGGVFAYVNRDL